ncbi:MAG TPA: hypothetical protein ENK88_05370, partial [Campylobacterales bacterium]|nr:hypothetical protein [Campylobacterales bacterium]
HTILVELELSTPLSYPVEYRYETKDNNTLEDDDYLGVSGTVTFQPKELRKFIPITIIGDTDDENNESFVFKAQNDKDKNQTTITIIDDDTEVVVPDPVANISILKEGVEQSNFEIIEENIDNNITVRVSLSSPITKTGTLHYELKPIIPLNNSYNSMVKTPINGDLTFEIGERSKEFNITIIGDMINEYDNNFTIEFSNPVNLKFDNAQNSKDITVMIKDDDPLPVIGFMKSRYDTTEGQQYQIMLQLSSESYKTVEANITLNPKSSAEDSPDMDIDDFNLSTYHITIPFSNNINHNTMYILDINISSNPDNSNGEEAIFDINTTKNVTTIDTNNSTTIVIYEQNQNMLGNAFISLNNSSLGNGLWSSDGTPMGTLLFKDFMHNENTSNPRYITRVGDNSLYFVADNIDYNSELYITDGNENNITRLYEFNNSSMIHNLIDVDGKLYFIVSDMENYKAYIWSSEGTVETTHQLLELSGAAALEPTNNFWVNIGKTLYFSANNNGTGEDDIELYKLDTLTDTLSLVKDIKVGSEGSYPENFVVYGTTLYFTANGSKEIWQTNGTTIGIEMVMTARDNGINEMIVSNDILYYAMNGYPESRLEGLNLLDGTPYNVISYDDGGNISAMGDVNGHLIYVYASSSNYKFVRVDIATAIDLEPIQGYPYPTKVFNGFYFYAINGSVYSIDGINPSTLLRVGENDNENITFINDTYNHQLFFKVGEYGINNQSLFVTDGIPMNTVELLH